MRASVIYVDVASQKLLDKVELTHPDFNTGHLALTDSGDLAVVSAPRDGLPNQEQQRGGVSLRPKGTAVRTMELPEEITRRMVGETLSVSIHQPSGIVAATTPLGDVVTFWDIKKCKMVKSLDVARPRGVSLTLDGKYFVLTHGEKIHDVLLISTDTLEIVPDSKIADSFITGSHVITYPMPG